MMDYMRLSLRGRKKIMRVSYSMHFRSLEQNGLIQIGSDHFS